MSDAPPPPSSEATERPRSEPNFAARRMLVTTVAITAIVAFAVVAWQVVRGDDDGILGTASGWDELAIVDRGSGEIVVLGDDGEPERTFVGLGPVTEAYVVDDRIALVGRDQIVLQGGDEAEVIAVDRSSMVTPIRTDDGLHLVIGEPSGGDVRIVDVRSGDVLDIGAMAGQTSPLLFAETVQWAADGSAFAVADAASFQTIVVRPDDEEARFFPSQPVALDDERVATSQIVGRQADIGLFDYERDSKARVPTEIPAGGVVVDGTLIMIATEGAISSVSDGDAEAQSLGSITVPAGGTVVSVAPSLDGERLVVTGDVFQAVVDLEGTTLFTTTFTGAIDAPRPHPSWSCLPVGGGTSYHSIVMLETGEQVADLTGVAVTGTSDDGCTVIGERAGVTEVIGVDGSVSLGQVRAATIGPDGRTVVRTTTAGATELLRIDDDLALDDPIDLSESVGPNAIVAFLQ